jgi:hypothetical protein
LGDLPGGPFGAWGFGDVEMQDLAAIVGQDQEYEQDFKRGCWYGEEIHRNQI